MNLAAAPKQPQTLDEWTELLRVQEMPIFSNTAHSIYAALDDRNKGAIELATVILQDPNLTAKLLKIGSSPYYNPSKQKMSTVSRAIVVLGAEVIRELTLACSFFEAILSSSNKDRANREIAQALHAAVQAKDLALTMGDTSPEEVFVAALLHNIGHIAFWCSNNPQSLRIHQLIEKSGLESREAEKKVLGFSLQELGKRLCKSWSLGGLIENAIARPDAGDKRVQTVKLGHQICEALKFGRDSAQLTDCLQQLAALCGQSPEQLRAKISKNTSEAIHIARQFGANDASRFISSEAEAALDDAVDEQIDKKQVQFQILQDITSLISGRIDLNVLFEMVLEGIHRGVEMDRTLFMLLSPDKQTLNEKFSLGWQKADMGEKIHIRNTESHANLFFQAFQQPDDGLWHDPERQAGLYTPQIQQLVGKHECFVFPVYAEHKPVGLIYCDHSIHGLPLTREDFTAAKHFAKQAHIGLTLYCMKSH